MLLRSVSPHECRGFLVPLCIEDGGILREMLVVWKSFNGVGVVVEKVLRVS